MLYPMFAMVVLITLVASRLLYLRIKAVQTREISIGEFRLNKGEKIPNHIKQAANNFSNLFEVPVLFFVACTLAIQLQKNSEWMLLLAWAFVTSRVLHSWIHITYNNVIHRLAAYLFGVAMVLLMWILLLCQ